MASSPVQRPASQWATLDYNYSESSGPHKPKVDLTWYDWGANSAAPPHLFLLSVICDQVSSVLAAGLVW